MSEFTAVLVYASTVTPLARVGGAPQSTILATKEEEALDDSSCRNYITETSVTKSAACLILIQLQLASVCTFHSITVLWNSQMHTGVAGFGVQVPFDDTPSDVHSAVIFPVGTNPVLHLKSISAPPSVLGTATMEPFSGATGVPQVTGRNLKNLK